MRYCPSCQIIALRHSPCPSHRIQCLHLASPSVAQTSGAAVKSEARQSLNPFSLLLPVKGFNYTNSLVPHSLQPNVSGQEALRSITARCSHLPRVSTHEFEASLRPNGTSHLNPMLRVAVLTTWSRSVILKSTWSPRAASSSFSHEATSIPGTYAAIALRRRKCNCNRRAAKGHC